MGNFDEPLTFTVNGKTVTTAEEAASASKPPSSLRAAAASFQAIHGPRFQKLNHWHSAQPRDKFGRWTKGFVSGAYSPLSKPKAGDVAPIVSHEAGSPFAPGGAYHGNAPGWQTGKKAVGQVAGSARPDIGGGNVALGGAKPLALGPGGPTVDPEVVQTAAGAAGANGQAAGGTGAGSNTDATTAVDPATANATHANFTNGSRLTPVVFRGSVAGGANEQRSAMAPKGVYVSTHAGTAESWGDAKPYVVHKQPKLLDLGKMDPRTTAFVARAAGLGADEIHEVNDPETFREHAGDVFLQNSGVDLLRDYGYDGYRLGHDAFVLGDLKGFAKPGTPDEIAAAYQSKTGKLTPPVIPKKATAADKAEQKAQAKNKADGQKAFEAVISDKNDGWHEKAKKILARNPAAHEHMVALLQARADDPNMAGWRRENVREFIRDLAHYSPEGQARDAEIRQGHKTSQEAYTAGVYVLGGGDDPGKATAILDANPDVAAKLEAIAGGTGDENWSTEQRARIGAFLHDYTERRRPIGPVDPDNPEADDAIAGSLNVTKHDGSIGQIAGTQWQHPAGARWDAGLKDLDLHNPVDDSQFKAAKTSALNAYATSDRAVERVNAAIAKADPEQADALRKKYAPLFYDHARIKKIADEINDPRYASHRQGSRSIEAHAKSAEMAAGIAQHAPASFRDAVAGGLLGEGGADPGKVQRLAEQLELQSGQPVVRNAELPSVNTTTGGYRNAPAGTAGESYGGNAGGPARYDAKLPRGEKAARAIVEGAHAHLQANVAAAEAAMRDGTLDERANMRERYAAMYYDMHRAARVARASDPNAKAAALAHLRATSGIAKMIAAGKYETLDDAIRNGRKLPGHKGAETDNQVAREYLLHKHSMDFRDDMDHLSSGVQQLSRASGAFTFKDPSDPKKLERAQHIDEAVEGTFGKNSRGARVTTIANATADTPQWTPSHAFPSLGHINMIENPGRKEFSDPNEYKRTVAHEMAHALSGDQLKPEFEQFNDFMKEQVPTRSATGQGTYADKADALGNEITQYRPNHSITDARGERPHVRQFITQHGANEKNHDRRDYQEDWAIGLTDGGLSDFQGTGRAAAARVISNGADPGLPTKQAAQKLEEIFGKKAVAGTDHLRDMPKVDADGYRIGESPEQQQARESYLRDAHADSSDHQNAYPGHDEMERRMGGRDAVAARLRARAAAKEKFRATGRL